MTIASDHTAMILSRADHGDSTILRLQGVLDAVSAANVRPMLDALLAEERNNVVLELSELRLIDSTGVGTIVALYKQMRRRGGQVTVVGLRDQPLAVFRLLQLDRALAAAG